MIVPTLRNVTTGQVLATNVLRADGLFERMLGFIPRAEIQPDDGLWFDNCSAVHTVGMRERIDVIFLDKSNRVIRVERSVPRFRLVVTCLGACAVVELGEANITGRDLLAGDELSLE
ncbi:MAG: DUF192 domain-containing protein [Vulcanimicrobiaceae bacterium]